MAILETTTKLWPKKEESDHLPWWQFHWDTCGAGSKGEEWAQDDAERQVLTEGSWETSSPQSDHQSFRKSDMQSQTALE